MSATLLHFGPDDCNRLIVLQSAGYRVDLSPSLQELYSAFERSLRPDAVLMTANDQAERRQAVTLVRAHLPTPLVLFQHSDYCPDESEFDLVIPTLTPPSEWLQKIADLIQRSSKPIADSRQIRQESALIQREADIIRRASMLAREDAVAARRNLSPPPAPKSPRKTG